MATLDLSLNLALRLGFLFDFLVSRLVPFLQLHKSRLALFIHLSFTIALFVGLSQCLHFDFLGLSSFLFLQKDNIFV